MTKTFAAFLAAGLVALPAVAPAADATRFTRDGVTYAYTTARKGDATVLTGHTVTDGSRFELIVRGTRVTGTVGRDRVDFEVAKPLAESLNLSQR